MAQLIDTSVFVALERRRLPFSALAQAAPEEPVALASITASELLTGVDRADSPERRLRREAFVEAILDTIPVIPFDLRVARTHAHLWAHLARVGQLIGAHDLLIAATVLTQKIREFERVPGLVMRQPDW